jgi:heme-degrading monooxygenase HmoA
MLIRIVRMHFTQSGVEQFLQIFGENKQAIRNVKGCSHLELLKDIHDPLIYTTLSHWDTADSLELYRNSELFKNVWGRVKMLMSERSQAYSLEKYIEL